MIFGKNKNKSKPASSSAAASSNPPASAAKQKKGSADAKALNKKLKLQKKLNAAVMMYSLMQQLSMDEDTQHSLQELIREIAVFDPMQLDKDTLASWNRQILSMETDELRETCRRLYVKELIPQAYRQSASLPVEDKILFFQPRKGLNLSFRYIFHKIESDYPYTAKLCELNRGTVCTVEHYNNALAYMHELATAKAIVFHSTFDYMGYVDIRPETKVVQLWHGCGIIKHVGMSTAGKPGYKTLEEYAEYPEFNKFDIVTMPGEEQRWVYEEFMGLEKGDPMLQAIGVSRTDEFFDPAYIDECYRKLYEKIPQAKEKKVILYAPTYRGDEPCRTSPDELDIPAFAKALSEEYILIIKHHQTAKNLPEIPQPYRDSFAFDMTRGQGMNINELMTVADICISDYSSVVYEYALLERPIVFFMFDLDDYRDQRGMYYSYESFEDCGPILFTNEELIDYILHVAERFDKEKVIAFKNKYMSACDGHSTERIMHFIES